MENASELRACWEVVGVITSDGKEELFTRDDWNKLLRQSQILQWVLFGHPGFKTKDPIVDAFGKLVVDLSGFNLDRHTIRAMVSLACGRTVRPLDKKLMHSLEEAVQVLACDKAVFDVWKQTVKETPKPVAPNEDVFNDYEWRFLEKPDMGCHSLEIQKQGYVMSKVDVINSQQSHYYFRRERHI